LRKLQTAQQYLMNSAKPEDGDVIALQELFLDSLGNMKASPFWRVLYPPDHHRDNSNHSCSILLINTNINTNSYTPLDIHCSDITAVCFSSKFGHVSIFNIYNNCTHDDSLTSL
ncbi:hypothetical protein L208DRAFT_1201912, partial [Tricholoma matsutake]